MSEAAAQLDTATAEDQPEKSAALPITQGRFQLEVEASNRWRVNVPMGTTPEDLLNESYWQHIATQLRPGDEIRAMPDNMAWELTLHVIGAGKLYAHVVKKTLFDLAPLEQPIKLPSIYEVKFQGSHHKWAVIRENKPLKDGFETEGLARRYAQNHEAAVNR